MATPLDRLLPRLEEEIRARWAARTRWASRRFDSEEARQRPFVRREPLLASLASLEARAGSPALDLACSIARQEVERGTQANAPADSVVSLLIGRESARDVLGEHLDPAQLAEVMREIDDAFDRVIALCGQTSCSICLSHQEESRTRVERRLESVIEGSLDAIVLCDERWAVEDWNAGATALFGWTREEMRGRAIEALFCAPEPGAAHATSSSLLERVRKEAHVRMPELELLRRDGSRVWVDASLSLVRNAEGRTLGLWALFRDVTESRAQTEERLQAERLALVGTMSARFAHEIRNPLASILINLDLLRDSLNRRKPLQAESGTVPGAVPWAAGVGSPAVTEDEETVTSIASEVGRIQSVVQEYLRFARLPMMRRSAIELDDLLRRHIGILEPELTRQGIALTLDLGAPDVMVDADEDQLWQAVLNLARNAMEAISGGGRITVVTRLDGDRVVCSVADTGSGMSREVMDRMFSPFFSTKPGGTGLGMPFVRQVLIEHGTNLTCDSTPGRGTKFTFSLDVLSVHEG
jgi:PAS domain S-box-containing protein